jgi:hypothetical protein
MSDMMRDLWKVSGLYVERGMKNCSEDEKKIETGEKKL